MNAKTFRTPADRQLARISHEQIRVDLARSRRKPSGAGRARERRENAAEAPSPAWGDAVGPRACCDMSPQRDFAGLRRGPQRGTRAGVQEAGFRSEWAGSATTLHE